jgi:hypothetical protein
VEMAVPEVAVGSRERESRAVGDGEPEALHWRRRRTAELEAAVQWVLLGCCRLRATAVLVY